MSDGTLESPVPEWTHGEVQKHEGPDHRRIRASFYLAPPHEPGVLGAILPPFKEFIRRFSLLREGSEVPVDSAGDTELLLLLYLS